MSTDVNRLQFFSRGGISRSWGLFSLIVGVDFMSTDVNSKQLFSARFLQERGRREHREKINVSYIFIIYIIIYQYIIYNNSINNPCNVKSPRSLL